jgi:hypothetical protein
MVMDQDLDNALGFLLDHSYQLVSVRFSLSLALTGMRQRPGDRLSLRPAPRLAHHKIAWFSSCSVVFDSFERLWCPFAPMTT